MYHTIEFDQALTLDLEISRKQPVERAMIKKGTQYRAQVKPYGVRM